MHVRALSFAAVSLSALIAATPSLANTEDQATAPHLIEGVVVTADPLGRRNDVVSSAAVITGDNLVHRRQSTLGETLSGIPGVNSDTFGGGASRPVVRGQTSPRVKVLSDGSALMDASEVSPDHAVSGEPLLLHGIEILRGPSALLYGGGAIGGAVNLIDKKVPTALPTDGMDVVMEARGGTADKERAGVIGATFGLGAFALRLEAAARDTDDYDVPFYTPAGHDDHDHEGDHDDHVEGFDRLLGSFNETRTATVGGSWIGDRGYFGVAFTEQRSNYGLPGHSHEYESCHPHGDSLHCGGHGPDDDHDHDHDHGEEAPVVDLLSRRWDVRGEIREPFAGIERIRFRGGVTDYRHDELEGGVIGTTFTNEGHDARVEIQHAPVAGFRGVLGAQVSRSDFAAVGVEAFLPDSRTDNHALFLLEEYVDGDWTLEAAVRQEWQEAGALGHADVTHKPFSVSASARWAFTPGYALSFTLARSQRAPSAQELFARGVHIATNTFEIGDQDLDAETVRSVELGFRKTSGDTTFSLGAYRYQYDGYIHAQTLDRFEDFRLIRYSQDDATFTGLEGEITHHFSPALSLSVFGDQVRAELANGEDLPRIPAARLGARADFHQGPWMGSLEYTHVFDQKDIATFETETPGYDMLNATLARDLDWAGTQSQVFLRATNLLDEVALNHASFITDAAPMRGRNLVIGVRAAF